MPRGNTYTMSSKTFKKKNYNNCNLSSKVLFLKQNEIINVLQLDACWKMLTVLVDYSVSKQLIVYLQKHYYDCIVIIQCY